jgi:hypothetical protein
MIVRFSPFLHPKRVLELELGGSSWEEQLHQQQEEPLHFEQKKLTLLLNEENWKEDTTTEMIFYISWK